MRTLNPENDAQQHNKKHNKSQQHQGRHVERSETSPEHMQADKSEKHDNTVAFQEISPGGRNDDLF